MLRKLGFFRLLLVGAFGTACTGQLTEQANETKVPLDCSATQAAPAPMRLLTRRQYDNTLRDLLGDDSQPSRNFPPENQVLGFDNNAHAHQISPLLLERYMQAAEDVSARAVASQLDALAPCAAKQDALACGQSFIQSFGARAFRRPLQEAEAAAFERLFSDTLAQADYAEAIELVLSAVLQSPQFLYRIESLDGTASDGAVALGGYELASRLSYLFWDTMPDAELFQAAAAGKLATLVELEAQARRMLADPRARQTVMNFNRQWLGMDELDSVARQADGVDMSALRSDWKSSLAMFADHAYFDAGSFAALMTSPTLFVNEALAPLYGAQVPASGFVPVDLPETRAGLLTQPALMALLSHPNQSAPIRRGVFVRERILCDTLPTPPPNVDQTPPTPEPGATTRERFQAHTAISECKSCHTLIDPIGFGFEHYDQVGRYRELDNSLAIDASGEVVGVDDRAIAGEFDGAHELSAKLAESTQAQACLATHWYRYAAGRVETDVDACSIAQLAASLSGNGSLKELLVALTQTEAFRYRLADDAEAR